VQVVEIANMTLKKWLEEFKAIPSGALTLGDVWLEDALGKELETEGRKDSMSREMIFMIDKNIGKRR